MKDGLHPYKWLSLIGSFGSVIVLIESLSLELPVIQQITTAGQGKVYLVGCIVGFSVSLLVLYSVAPYFFEVYGATVYNLSMLTTSLYGLAFEVLLLHQVEYDWLYFVGFGLVLIGIGLYNVPQPRHSKDEFEDDTSVALQVNLVK